MDTVLYARVYENHHPLDLDELQGYEILSLIDEVSHMLNPRPKWNPTTRRMEGSRKQLYDIVALHDVLQITGPFPDDMRTLLLTHSIHVYPENYGRHINAPDWGHVILHFVADRTPHTTSEAPEEAH